MAPSNLMGTFYFVTLFTVVVTSSAPVAIAAEEFKVGGDEGWRQPAADETEMYDRWASTRRFHVGDSLRFDYKNDTVIVVDKWGYYHCNSSHPILVFNDGDTVIDLEKPGLAYFVSADPDHCKNGQRLMVEVIPLHGSPAPSPFSGAGSSTYSVVKELVLFYVILIVAFIDM